MIWRRIQKRTAICGLAFACALCLSGCTHESAELPRPAETQIVANPININAASEDELRSLPYIGDKLAAEIVEFRTKNGGFHRPEQLLLLRGISEKRFREIRRFIVTE